MLLTFEVMCRVSAGLLRNNWQEKSKRWEILLREHCERKHRGSKLSHTAILTDEETGVEREVCCTTVYSKKDAPKSFGNSRGVS